MIGLRWIEQIKSYFYFLLDCGAFVVRSVHNVMWLLLADDFTLHHFLWFLKTLHQATPWNGRGSTAKEQFYVFHAVRLCRCSQITTGMTTLAWSWWHQPRIEGREQRLINDFSNFKFHSCFQKKNSTVKIWILDVDFRETVAKLDWFATTKVNRLNPIRSQQMNLPSCKLIK